MEQTSLAEQPNQLSKSIDVAVKFAGDFAIVPGASQFMHGKMASGLGHAAVGIILRGVVGPVGWAAIAANSFTKSMSNKNIWSHVVGAKDTVVDNRKQHKHESLLAELKAARAKDEADRSDNDNELLAVASELGATRQKEQSPLKTQK